MRNVVFSSRAAWLPAFFAGAMLLVVIGTVSAQAQAASPPAKPLDVQFLEACENFDGPVVEALSQQGVPETAKDSSGQTLLMIVANGHPDLVKSLLNHKPDLNAKRPADGATALYIACAADDAASAKELLEAGADPNLAIKTARTPLLAAIEGNDPALAILLVNHHADPNQGFSEGTPLACAVCREQVDVATALLAAGAKADLTNTNSSGQALMTLVAKAAVDDNHAMIDLLLAHGGKIEETDVNGGTPLLQALWHGSPSAIDYLLAKGADVNHADLKEDTPLMTAMVFQTESIWNELVDRGAKIDPVNRDGQSALIMAASVANKKAVRFLLDHNANPNLVDARGETALTYAGDRGMAELVYWLKDAGATQTNIRIIPKPMPKTPLPSARRWELALGAIYAQVDGGNPNTLGGDYSSTRAHHILDHDWRVSDPGAVLRMIHFFIYPGERKDFQHHEGYVDLDSPRIIQGLRYGKRDRLELIRKNYVTWKDASGLGGDVCRAAHLVNLGVAAGYLDDDQAWSLLDAIAAETEGHFDSWSALNNNFLDSREMWGGVVDPQFESCGQLLTNTADPGSPWNQIPWNTPLGITPVVHETAPTMAAPENNRQTPAQSASSGKSNID